MNIKDKDCDLCGKTFSPTGSKQRICTDDHQIPCKYDKCENTFSYVRRKEFCGFKCGRLYQIENAPMRTVECIECGVEFETNANNKAFCKEMHERECVICGNEFVRKMPSKVVTCSKPCQKAKTEQTNLENHGVRNQFQREDVKSLISKLRTEEEVKKRAKKARQTNLARYGVENPLQLDYVKEKISKTNMERYGVENPGQHPDFQEKMRNTNLERYGVEFSFQSEEIKSKIKETVQERYGVDHAAAAPEIVAARKKTNMDRYGHDNPGAASEVQEKIRDTMLERFGVESIFLLPSFQQEHSVKNPYRVSKINRGWQSKLKYELGVEFDYEALFGKNRYADLGYGDLLIDINPTSTHNSTIPYLHLVNKCKDQSACNHQGKVATSHQDRALAAEQSGKTLLQYFEWMDPTIFISIIRSKLQLDTHKVYAKSTELRVIDQATANRFLRENHLSGASNKQTYCVGLYYDDQLVHVQTYGPARISKTAQWEAIRSCTKMNWAVIGGFSKCEKAFFAKHDPESMVSYVDLSISQGETESRLGGAIHRTNKPNLHWVKFGENPDGQPRFIRDSTARRVGADRLLGMEMGEKYPMTHDDGSKVTNEFVLLSEGYVQVYDAGTRTYLLQR